MKSRLVMFLLLVLLPAAMGCPEKADNSADAAKADDAAKAEDAKADDAAKAEDAKADDAAAAGDAKTEDAKADGE